MAFLLSIFSRWLFMAGYSYSSHSIGMEFSISSILIANIPVITQISETEDQKSISLNFFKMQIFCRNVFVLARSGFN